MSDGIARFKDFTGDSGPITFALNGETFTAYEDIPLKHLGDLADIGKEFESKQGDAMGKMERLFEKLLEPESYTRFHASMTGQSTNVIGVNRIKQIIPWLLEQYGLRPTEASSGSGTTSSESGASSTDGAPPVVSTSPTRARVAV